MFWFEAGAVQVLLVMTVLQLGQVDREHGAMKGQKEARVLGFLNEFGKGEDNLGLAQTAL